MNGIHGKVLQRVRWGTLAALMVATSIAWGNTPLPGSGSVGDTPGTTLAEKSREARQAAASQPAPEIVAPEEELGPLEDIASTATLFLLDPVKPEAIERVEVGDGLVITARISVGDAEVYVIEPTTALPFELPVLTLSEAQAQGLIEIREITREEVEAFRAQYPAGGGGMVVAKNKADVYVLFAGGEVLDGGNQDRMVASSAILPPQSGWIPLPVNCVEKGRSQGTSPKFSVADATAHPMLRAQGICRTNQEAVWGEVQRVNRIESSMSPTHTYMQVWKNGRSRKAIEEKTGAISQVLDQHPNAVGLVFVRGGKVQSVERFGSPALFRAEKASIIASHLLGLASRNPAGTSAGAPTTASADELKAFFSSMREAERVRAPLNYQGIGVVFRSPRLLGGETVTNVAPKDPLLRTFAADLSKGGPAPPVLSQWAVRIN